MQFGIWGDGPAMIPAVPTPPRHTLVAAGGPSVVLASASPARAAMLAAAGVPVACRPAAVDEAAVREALRAEGVAAADAATALAELKGQRVAADVPPESIVIAADQILSCDGRWFDKPGDRAAARAQLAALRGRRHELASAAVAFRGGARVWHAVGTARLAVRPFSDAFLDAYLDAAGGAVLGSVGAYHLEGLGAQLLADVDGDPFVVQGLPLLPLLAFLRDQGVLPR
jgi:septum formation protein